YTLQGFGTTFYGARDFHSDGSYITTEWMVIGWVPIIPLRSLRVRYQGAGAPPRFPIGIGYSHSYAVHETGAPNWKQVLYTYLYVIFYGCWLSGRLSHKLIVLILMSSRSWSPNRLATTYLADYFFLVWSLPHRSRFFSGGGPGSESQTDNPRYDGAFSISSEMVAGTRKDG